MVGEFDLIKQYFKPLAGDEGLSLLDDAACVSPEAGKDLIISKDVLVSGVHFFRDDDPCDIAKKSLAVNLSDLAAKGAVPRYYVLGLSLPQTISSDWLSSFANGLKDMQDACGISLIGGDTTKSPTDTITISVTVFGAAKRGRMIKRSGAKVGDDIYVTGHIGLAAFGLLVRQGKVSSDDRSLLERYLRPQVRYELGPKLIGVASASADISDGLLADIGHICAASGVGAKISLPDIPISESVKAISKSYPKYSSLLWSGGDDYEIIFTANRTMRQAISNLSNDFNTLITRVGHITSEKSVLLIQENGDVIDTPEKGYMHF
ncbi:thiamine-phosphate kinase [Kordiimonas sp. SCSIO 12610]|uniref:thiamine-phosphate kinase n=1 Tax=Kordiimonas sp. SCSIO 12610 TaxID=2829597 RepID=UPI00210F08AC|nr:thiamine-phosphate kinase [Kordiimonas sp. SCSIO 12610]UTW54118.1 thiamine-phosphate kinase [Kordiimonas sp. SCSIO 12610]